MSYFSVVFLSGACVFIVSGVGVYGLLSKICARSQPPIVIAVVDEPITALSEVPPIEITNVYVV